MSKDFLEKRIGSKEIDLAQRQHRQLSYFTTSKIQGRITQEYLNAYVERQYSSTDDYFLNWVKTVFKTDNFLSFFRHYREPNAAATLINGRIKEPLKRVFYAEDSYFRYVINGDDVEEPKVLDDGFEERLFEAALFRYNDIIIHDLKDVNSPYRDFLDIEKLVAIDSKDGNIRKIGYTAEMFFENETEPTRGYIYMDDERYKFCNTDYVDLVDEPHDLGYCPAFFVSNERFGQDDAVRTSMFSYIRADLEEYVFLKTLQRMTEPNGAVPVAVKFKTNEHKSGGRESGLPKGHPLSASTIAGHQSNEVRSSATPADSIFQAGTVIDVPMKYKHDGSVDTDILQNFVKYHHTPITALEYLNKRIRQVEQNIIIAALGDYQEANEDAMNELQVSKSYVSKEDKLRGLSILLSDARQKSDRTMLGLAHGINNIKADCFYGSDFFQETQEQIYDLIQKSPNAIERKNLLIRAAQIRNRFNRSKAEKEKVLYKMLPYSSDADFKIALDNFGESMPPEVFELQTRFDYWVMLFEAKYGDTLTFWEGMGDTPESNKLSVLTKLMNDLIKETINVNIDKNGTERNQGGTPASV